MKQKESAVAPRYVSLKEAAVYLGLSQKTLSRLVEQRRIAFIALNVLPSGETPKRMLIRFDLRELEKFMAAAAVVPPKPLAWALPSAPSSATGSP